MMLDRIGHENRATISSGGRDQGLGRETAIRGGRLPGPGREANVDGPRREAIKGGWVDGFDGLTETPRVPRGLQETD